MTASSATDGCGASSRCLERLSRCAALLLLLATGAATATAQSSPTRAGPGDHLNLGFETSGLTMPDLPAGWSTHGVGYEFALDSVAPRAGTRSLRIRARGESWGGTSGMSSGGAPVRGAEGKAVRLRGYMRSDGITQGHAALWLRAEDANGKVVAFEDMSTRGVTGTSPWTAYEVTLPLSSSITHVGFGVRHRGNGTAWFDALELSVDGRSWAEVVGPNLAPTRDELAWIRRRALPLSSVDAGTPRADLEPLRPLLGDARIVALGEGTHGTSEFFRFKHRLTEFLATTEGFTVFAIEANMPEARRVNDYVLTGRGDPAALLGGLYFWTWNTREVLALIEWMRAYNASGKGRMEFWGFDLQTPDVAMDSVRAFVSRADSSFVPVVDSSYAFVRMMTHPARRRPWPPPTSPDEQLRAAAVRVLSHLEPRRTGYVAAGRDSMEVAWAVQYARIVLQGIHAGAGGGRSRDSSMAANIRWMMEHLPAGTKAVLWAHNGHVERRAGVMGAHLDATYGTAMRVVGFAMGEGQYTAMGWRGFGSYPAAAPPLGSVESALRAARIPRFALDLRGAEREAGGRWLSERREFRAIGAVAVERSFSPTPVALRYDLLVYLDQTSPTRPMPGVGQR